MVAQNIVVPNTHMLNFAEQNIAASGNNGIKTCPDAQPVGTVGASNMRNVVHSAAIGYLSVENIQHGRGLNFGAVC